MKYATGGRGSNFSHELKSEQAGFNKICAGFNSSILSHCVIQLASLAVGELKPSTFSRIK